MGATVSVTPHGAWVFFYSGPEASGFASSLQSACYAETGRPPRGGSCENTPVGVCIKGVRHPKMGGMPASPLLDILGLQICEGCFSAYLQAKIVQKRNNCGQKEEFLLLPPTSPPTPPTSPPTPRTISRTPATFSPSIFNLPAASPKSR